MLDGNPLLSLASFAAELRDSKKPQGTDVPPEGSGTEDDPFRPGYWKAPKLLEDFVEMVYDQKWVDMDFDWTQWTGHRDFLAGARSIASATAEELRHLVTSIVRVDRLSEGVLEKCYRDGTLLAISERAEQLVGGPVPPRVPKVNPAAFLDRPPIDNVVESDLDFALVFGLFVSPEFRQSFLKLIAPDLGEVQYEGAWRSVSDGNLGETDVLVLVTTDQGKKVAILIEDKIDATFQPEQAERYSKRGELGQKQGAWDDFRTCLLGPADYLSSAPGPWGKTVTLESLRKILLMSPNDRSDVSLFICNVVAACIEKWESKKLPMNEAAVSFWKQYSALCSQEHPTLKMTPLNSHQSKADPWPRFNAKTLGPKVILVHKPTQGRVDLTFDNIPEEVVRQKFTHELKIGISLVKAGKSSAIRIDVPPLNHLEPFEGQRLKVVEALMAAEALLGVWERNRMAISQFG